MSTDRYKDKENMRYTYTHIHTHVYTHTHTHTHTHTMLLSHKEWNPAIYNMVGPWGYDAKWSKLDKERQTPYDLIHMWNRNTNTGTYQWINKTKTKRVKEQITSYQKRRVLGDGWLGRRASTVWWWMVTRLVGGNNFVLQTDVEP